MSIQSREYAQRVVCVFSSNASIFIFFMTLKKLYIFSKFYLFTSRRFVRGRETEWGRDLD